MSTETTDKKKPDEQKKWEIGSGYLEALQRSEGPKFLAEARATYGVSERSVHVYAKLYRETFPDVAAKADAALAAKKAADADVKKAQADAEKAAQNIRSLMEKAGASFGKSRACMGEAAKAYAEAYAEALAREDWKAMRYASAAEWSAAEFGPDHDWAPEARRSIIAFLVASGRTYRQVAAAMGVNASTVSRSLAEGRSAWDAADEILVARRNKNQEAAARREEEKRAAEKAKAEERAKAKSDERFRSECSRVLDYIVHGHDGMTGRELADTDPRLTTGPAEGEGGLYAMLLHLKGDGYLRDELGEGGSIRAADCTWHVIPLADRIAALGRDDEERALRWLAEATENDHVENLMAKANEFASAWDTEPFQSAWDDMLDHENEHDENEHDEDEHDEHDEDGPEEGAEGKQDGTETLDPTSRPPPAGHQLTGRLRRRRDHGQPGR